MDESRAAEYQQTMLELIPADGSTVGNKTLNAAWIVKVLSLGLPAPAGDDYWKVRNALIEAGAIAKGRGLGGSVRLNLATNPPIAQPTPPSNYPDEASLYVPFAATIKDYFTKDYGIDRFTCDITAAQGRRNTGGKWTRPDLTLVAVRTYRFIPGKSLEVITFEVKPVGGLGVEGVYETASHSAFANRAYLALHTPTEILDASLMDRVLNECERFKIGFITFEDPADWNSFDIKLEPENSSPDPAKLNDFIRTQVPSTSQSELDQLIR